MIRTFFLAALLGLGAAAPGPAAGRAPGAAAAPLPGDARWDYGAWADDYLVVATDYDAKSGQVTWTLEARHKVKAERYEAHFADPDLIELEARQIQFAPAEAEYKKGARIKATMRLPPPDVMEEVNQVKVSPVR